MANKILKKNNAAKKASKKAAAPKKTKVVAVKAEPKDQGKLDLDLSTVRKSSQQNKDDRFVTFMAKDKHSGNDVICVEHKDYVSGPLREALEKKGLL